MKNRITKSLETIYDGLTWVSYWILHIACFIVFLVYNSYFVIFFTRAETPQIWLRVYLIFLGLQWGLSLIISGLILRDENDQGQIFYYQVLSLFVSVLFIYITLLIDYGGGTANSDEARKYYSSAIAVIIGFILPIDLPVKAKLASRMNWFFTELWNGFVEIYKYKYRYCLQDRMQRIEGLFRHLGKQCIVKAESIACGKFFVFNVFLFALGSLFLVLILNIRKKSGGCIAVLSVTVITVVIAIIHEKMKRKGERHAHHRKTI